MPGLDDEVGVKGRVHLNGHVGRDGDDRGEVENPAEEVQEAGEEANHAAVAGTGGYGCPVVDAAGRGDGRRQLEVLA